MNAAHEQHRLAQRLIEATCFKQGIVPHQLTDPRRPRRADAQQAGRRAVLGPPHRRESLAASREQRQSVFRSPIPHVQIPAGVSEPVWIARARAHVSATDLFDMVSPTAHHHSGLSFLTPADVHYGRAAVTLGVRHRTRVAAYVAHPERFVQGPPRLETLPHAVWINPPAKSTGQDAPGETTVTPADPQHRRGQAGHDVSRQTSIDRAHSRRGVATVNC